MPDARGRSAVGPDAGAGRVTSNNTLASTSGAETHTLSAAQTGVPTHGHADNIAATQGTHGHTITQGAVTNNAVSSGLNSVGHSHAFTTGTISATHYHFPDNAQGFVTGPISDVVPTGTGTTRYVGQSFSPGGRTGAEQGNHTHSGTTGGISANHTHSVTSNVTVGNPTTPAVSAGAITVTGGVTNHAGTAASSHNNMQPYLVLNKIIKY